MVKMEETLGEALPYWDWTEPGSVSGYGIWDDIQFPIQEGAEAVPDCTRRQCRDHLARRQCSRGSSRFTRRSGNVQNFFDFAELKEGVRETFKTTTFQAFSTQIAIPHNRFHTSMGCDMERIETAAYDAIFYLHHSYVDYQFAYWQALQQLRGLTIPFQSDQNNPLAPFNNPRYNNEQKTFGNNIGRETYNYEETLGYQYDDLMFDGMTPQQFLDGYPVGRTAASCPSNCTGCCDNAVYIGIILPKLDATGHHILQLCSNSTGSTVCVSAGQMSTFGDGLAQGDYSVPVNSSSHSVLEKIVTTVALDQCWPCEGLTALQTSNYNDYDFVNVLVLPVVIQRDPTTSTPGSPVAPGCSGTVTWTGQDIADYGNLLCSIDGDLGNDCA
jgi:hypothetical protein